MYRNAPAGFQKHMGIFALWSLLCLAFSSTALAQVYSTTSTGQQIGPDATCGTANELNLPIVVSDVFTVSDLNLGFQATTSYRGDLRIRLTSPSATTVELVTQDGGVGLANYNIELDDNPANDVINTGAHNTPDGTTAPPYENPVRTNNAGGGGLSAFTGEAANGTWTLNICDAFNADQGNFGVATLYFSSPTDADLSLAVSASNNSPVQTSTVNLTFDLLNSGPATATNVTAQIDLPSGLSYNSHSGPGTYDNATGLWTLPASLTNGSTTTLTINATVGYFGPYDISAEVTASNENDLDSTPNNNVPAEDDQDSLTLTPTPAATPPSLTCAAGDQFTHSWDAPGTTNGWTSGAMTDSYTVNGIDLDFTISGSTGSFMPYNGAATPVSNDVLTGGLPTAYGLFYLVDYPSNTSSLVTTIDVGVPGRGVGDAQFSLYDIDFDAGAFVDRITVAGFHNGTPVTPVLTPGTSNTVSGASVVGTGPSDLTQNAGNMTVTFLAPVDQITITYDNGPGAPTNPQQQGITLAPITMCPFLAADLTAVKSVEVYDPGNVGLYMTPGNEVLYRITVNNSAAATAEADSIDLSDTLPDNVRFVSATTTGFTGGSFGSPALPAANTDCAGGACVIRYSGATLAIDTTGEIQVRALIK